MDLSHVGNLGDPNRALLELCVRTKTTKKYNKCINNPKNKIPRGQSSYNVYYTAGNTQAIDVASTPVDEAGAQAAAGEAPASKNVPLPPEDQLAAMEHTLTQKAGHLLGWAQSSVRALSHQTARLSGASARALSPAAVKNLGGKRCGGSREWGRSE
ncbi:MAG: hypothetical protein M1826_007445 [Phylliscum demangeonii]|nr:MAG: hypothetical protein M1826_007445 [Phylliscum demangeonii]